MGGVAFAEQQPVVVPARIDARLQQAAQAREAAAVADGDQRPPRVVAKGKGTIGEKIIEIAKENDIPIQENEVLAGALSNVELGDEIPAELYKAVAEVLIFVMRLTGRLR